MSGRGCGTWGLHCVLWDLSLRTQGLWWWWVGLVAPWHMGSCLGIQPLSPALQGRSLTTGPLGESPPFWSEAASIQCGEPTVDALLEPWSLSSSPLILPSVPPPFLAALLWELKSSLPWRNNQESHRPQSKEMGGPYSRGPRPLSQHPPENPSSPLYLFYISQALNSFDSAFRGHQDRSWGTLETTLDEVAARALALSNKEPL